MSEHMLVVDDDPNIRAMVKLVLETAGNYTVVTATNGAEALAAIAQDPPSAMVLDMQMPVLDGWGVARQLREQGKRVPTVVMTAAADAARWCAEVGADACLAKPFDIDTLLAVVAQVRVPTTHSSAR